MTRIVQRRLTDMKNQFIVEEGPKVSFTIQDGPILEVGVNGCQIDDLITWVKTKLEFFNRTVPSRETSMVITKLDEALLWSLKRKMDREERGVEGTSKT